MSGSSAEGALGSLGSLASAAGHALRGVAAETARSAAHVASYPWELLREQIRPAGPHNRTDALGLTERSVLLSDLRAEGTPVLLVHGLMDNRSVFTAFRAALRGRGFGVVHGMSFSVRTALTGDVRAAAAELAEHVERLRERTGADRVHVVGHSLGGLVARYYVQRLGGDEAVHTLVTVGSPHGGSVAAYLLPTPLARQLQPGSDLLTELAGPAPRCRTRFLVVWSRMDQLVVPRRNARLEHPDLDVDTLELADVGHHSLSVHPTVVRWVAASLTRLDGPRAIRRGHRARRGPMIGCGGTGPAR
ncbi:esterase/lipase family protein [Pseudonocardia acaciae]|uniref:esterase/lipase family protein n=1 Tax=Pseudonocardia acaciae TaxID=551276 RepID=UPI0007E8B9D0|nr:alpha/beta fold hydrolase [Pseudonocardia acaciae]